MPSVAPRAGQRVRSPVLSWPASVAATHEYLEGWCTHERHVTMSHGLGMDKSAGVCCSRGLQRQERRSCGKGDEGRGAAADMIHDGTAAGLQARTTWTIALALINGKVVLVAIAVATALRIKVRGERARRGTLGGAGNSAHYRIKAGTERASTLRRQVWCAAAERSIGTTRGVRAYMQVRAHVRARVCVPTCRCERGVCARTCRSHSV